jgi:hypothetical protein
MLRGNNGISRFLLIHPTNIENDYGLSYQLRTKLSLQGLEYLLMYTPKSSVAHNNHSISGNA